jgi:hypothetical protein
VLLNRADQAGFLSYLHAVYDGSSRQYHHFLSQRQLSDRFGPSRQAYGQVLGWLRARGLNLVQGSANRLTLTVRGPRSRVARAFGTPIASYRVHGRDVYANTKPASLPASIAGAVQQVTGLSDLTAPTSPFDKAGGGRSRGAPGPEKVSCKSGACTIKYCPASGPCLTLVERNLADCAQVVQNAIAFIIATKNAWFSLALIMLNAVVCSLWGDQLNFNFQINLNGSLHKRGSPNAAPPSSPAQKIGLLEFDTYHQSDVSDWLSALGLNVPSVLGRLSQVPVGGGVSAPGAGEGEALLDVDTTLLDSAASQAKVVVYDAPPSATFVQVFNAMINDGDTVISNSWAQCEDQTSQADAQAIDSVLAQAAAGGVTVLNGSGDTGSTCLDGSPNTIGVPADSPHATAVGGSTVIPGDGGTYGHEEWWNGSQDDPVTGQGGFGVSKYFPTPAYQSALTNAPGRSVPDVVGVANPAEGPQICEADAGGCPNDLTYGGTSIAAPEWASTVADLNFKLGRNIGDLNAALYPLAGSSAFHDATALNSDFAHVGLGDDNYAQLLRRLANYTPGAVSASKSSVTAYGSQGAPVAGSQAVPADGKTQGTVRVDLRDANGFPLSGKQVSLTASSANATVSGPGGTTDSDSGSAVFTVTDTTSETVTFTARDSSDGLNLPTQPTLTFIPPVATGGQIQSNLSSVRNDGTSQATITVYLQNAQGRPAAGKTVSLGQGGGNAVITPAGSSTPGNTATTDSSGYATFHATDTHAESIDFTASDVTDGNLPVPGSAVVNFGPSTATCGTALPKAASGFSVSAFARGFAYNTEAVVYPGNFTEPACTTFESAPAIDAGGNAYIADGADGTIHVLGPTGGTPTAANQLPDANFPGGSLGGLAFTKDGSLYAGLIQSGGSVNNPEIVRLDPTTGAVLKVVASSATGLPDCPSVVVVDPLSGDLFTDDQCNGFATSNQISRIHDPGGANPTVSNYLTTGGCNLGMSFAPNGTLYLANCNGEVDSIGPTNTTNPSVTKIASVSGPPASVAVTGVSGAGKATQLEVFGFDGSVTAVDLTRKPAVISNAATGSSPFQITAIGRNGCGYGTIPGTVAKVGLSACGSTNTSPQITLAQRGSATPPTGSSVGFTAKLQNVAGASGTAIRFVITGPNRAARVVNADGTGQAVTRYTGSFEGVDTITASAVVNGTTITSAPILVHWRHGQDVTFLNLSASQQGGPSGQPATLTANLDDATLGAPLAGASVTLALNGQSCLATTDAAGNASCSVTPTGAAGLEPLTASYAGDSTHTPATASNVFALGALGLPPPPGPPPPPPSPPTPSPIPPASPAVGGVPVNTALPLIAGTPTPGNSLSCSTGSWSNGPTAFAYTWQRNGRTITGATGSRYTVRIPDEAQKLSCQVTASNLRGAGAPASSAAVLVALRNTTRCPKPTGKLSGGSVGVLKLGMSKRQARHKLKRFGVTHNAFDNFCLFAGWGIRAGYPSTKLLRSLPGRERKHVQGVVLLLTANPFYAFDKTRPGAKLTGSLSRHLHLGRVFHIGHNDWYIAASKPSDGVLKVRKGVVQEVGLADRRLLSGRKAQRRFLNSFSTT